MWVEEEPSVRVEIIVLVWSEADVDLVEVDSILVEEIDETADAMLTSRELLLVIMLHTGPAESLPQM